MYDLDNNNRFFVCMGLALRAITAASCDIGFFFHGGPDITAIPFSSHKNFLTHVARPSKDVVVKYRPLGAGE